MRVLFGVHNDGQRKATLGNGAQRNATLFKVVEGCERLCGTTLATLWTLCRVVGSCIATLWATMGGLYNVVTTVAVVGVIFFGTTWYSNSNFYVYGLGLTHCTSEASCLHEAGHRLDDELGNISRSKEFGDFLRVYVATHLDGDLEKNWLAYRILTYDGILNYSEQYYSGRERLSNPVQELYADIYLWFDGDITVMPVEFREFYE